MFSRLYKGLGRLALVFGLIVAGTGITQADQVDADAAHWQVIADQSTLTFTAQQSGSPVQGRFEQFRAHIHYDPQRPEEAMVRVIIDMTSATTDDETRDGLLQSEDFFDVANHPQAVFEGTGFLPRDGGSNGYSLEATLTIRGDARPVTLPFTLQVDRSEGIEQAHAQGKMTISRLAYGIGQGDWATTATVADEVVINLDIKATRAAP